MGAGPLELDDLDESDAAMLSAAIAAEQAAAAIHVQDSGHWFRYVYHGHGSYSFWVDLAVRNDSPDKQVGIVWTHDGWQTSHTAWARLEGWTGSHELWGVDVGDFVQAPTWQPGFDVEYAAFVTMNGATHWSPFRNHYLLERVSPSRPVRVLRSSLALDAGGEPILRATVRALNVSGERRVIARYTSDGWQTHEEAAASFDGTDFQLAVPLDVPRDRAEEVAFAVRLEAGGGSHWDNNGGANYTLRLAPALASLSFTADPEREAGGIQVVSGSFLGDLPVQAVLVSIDGGADIPLAWRDFVTHPDGFTAAGAFRHVFSTVGLADGEHSLAVRAVGAGGFVRTVGGYTFRVANRLDAVAGWSLAMRDMGSLFDWARDGQGRVHAMWSHQVIRYPELGSSDATFFEAVPEHTLMDITVDPEGRVYALTNGGTVLRWQDSGALDSGFAGLGRLDLHGVWGTSAFCFAGSIEATASFFYVVDSCGSRVLRVGHDGALAGEVNLGIDGVWTNVSETYADGSALWVQRHVLGELSRRELVRLTDDPAAPLEASGVIELDPAVTGVAAFAVASDGFWVASTSDDVHRIDAEGALAGTWLGGGVDADVPGALALAGRIEALPGGGAAVLSVQGSRIVQLAER